MRWATGSRANRGHVCGLCHNVMPSLSLRCRRRRLQRICSAAAPLPEPAQLQHSQPASVTGLSHTRQQQLPTAASAAAARASSHARQRRPSSMLLQQEVCIVTGANAGIGKEVAAGLMAHGAHVVLACRNMAACHQAAAELQSRGLAGSCQCSRLDLADHSSIREFAQQQRAQLARSRKPLRVLCNNAGVMGLGPGPGGADQHWAVNHLGPFLLTHLLIPAMGPGSRIVSTSSRAHKWGRLHVRDGAVVPGPQHWFPQYAASKLANVLMTAELQRRLQDSRGIIATSVSPGFVSSNIFTSVPPSLAWLLQGLASVVGRTPAQGARVSVHAATSPALTASAPVPLFLHDCKEARPSRLAHDKQLAADLWAASAAAVGLEEEQHCSAA